MVDIAHIVFNVDLFIDSSLTFRMEINACVGSADRSLVYNGKLTLYSVERLEDNASEFGAGGTRDSRNLATLRLVSKLNIALFPARW